MFEELYTPLPDVGAYLERIGLESPPPLTPEGLSELVFTHQKSVPFECYELCEENGSINIGIERLFDKVVNRRRGGYCFELNGIFYSLLIALGFDAYPVLARVMNPLNEHPVPLHRCNLVRFGDKRYFTDVGFGGNMPAGALLFEEASVQRIRNGDYRFDRVNDHMWQLMRLDGESWQPTVRFSEHPADIVDFIAPNFFCSDAPGSYFRSSRIANIYREDGFASLKDGEFKIVGADGAKTETITSKERELAVLREYFGITL